MITLEKNQTANPGINQFYTYDEAIEKAAAFCLEKIHPYLLVLYYFQISKKENHGENAVKIYEIKLLADKTIRKEPNKPWGYNLRGLFELEYGDPNKAENFFSVSLKYSKNGFPPGHSGLGRVHHKYSTFGNAIEKFKFAIEHGEDDPEVFWLLSESYYLLKKYEDAKQACEELRKLIYNEDYENNCQRIDNRQYRPKKGEGRNRYFFSNPLH